jgi:uncharacterized protein with von Willebrand factor type A (vWA) domain
MLLGLFLGLRAERVPVTLREHLTLIDALKAGEAAFDVDAFYYLSRAALIKDERYFDRFDRVFGRQFQGLDATLTAEQVLERELPEEWLRKLAEKHLSPEEMAEIEALGGWDELMRTLKERLAEQKKRHQGGSKWIGTAGTSPFGAYGYNPEGIRIGQEESRHRRAVKVWDRREYRDYDGDVEINTRSVKMALRRLRRWAREGSEEELDLEETIGATARNGYIDVRTRPERRNAVKVLLLLDVGGSMDDHVHLVEQLFSAAKSQFAHFEHYYFHNCLYEGVWQESARRRSAVIPTWDLLHRLGPDWRCIFVGDAAMSPYELVQAGGAVEHWNEEPGIIWLRRAVEHFTHSAWINPMPERFWEGTMSTQMIQEAMEDRMYPLTLEGLERGMRALS